MYTRPQSQEDLPSLLLILQPGPHQYGGGGGGSNDGASWGPGDRCAAGLESECRHSTTAAAAESAAAAATTAISLFNRWVKAGFRVKLTLDMRPGGLFISHLCRPVAATAKRWPA